MPKDPTKNIFQYKIRGGHLNEFEYQQNQGQVKEQHERPWEAPNFDPNAGKPEPVATTGRQVAKKAATKGKSAGAGAKKKTVAKPTKKKPAKGTKKSVAKKAPSKKTARKKAAKK